MSAFEDLCAEAEALGATKLVWSCDLKDYAKAPRQDGRWGCTASVATRDGSPVFLDALQARGRTGEEAMRRIVDFLKRTA